MGELIIRHFLIFFINMTGFVIFTVIYYSKLSNSIENFCSFDKIYLI